MNAVTTNLNKCSDIEQARDLWKSSLEKHAHLKKFRVKNKVSRCIRPDIRELIYKRDYIHKKAVQFSSSN